MPAGKRELVLGDSLVVLPTLEENSFDSVVTDPPYAISFMGKKWDAPGDFVSRPHGQATFDHVGGNHHPTSPQDAARTALSEGKKFQAWCERWGKEVLRVLKPGGFACVFGSVRTFHRMACGLEDAGFEIIDTLHWTFASGFPKGLDVSKALDAAAGVEREVIGLDDTRGHYDGSKRRESPHPGAKVYAQDDYTRAMTPLVERTAPATAEAKQWEGWRTQLKPSHELILICRKPLSERTIIANVLKWGTGALNIDASRVPLVGVPRHNVPGNGEVGSGVAYGGSWNGYDGPAEPHPDSARHDVRGRYPANTILSHADGCGPEGCSEGCPVRLLDEQTGHQEDRPAAKALSGEGSGSGKLRTSGTYGSGRLYLARTGYQTAGGASRFFLTLPYEPLFYCAKASKREREAGLSHLAARAASVGNTDDDGSTKPRRANIHPTVKPIALLRHLLKLVTMQGGRCLDPFAGSGSTLLAAVAEGFSCLAVEREADYHEIAVSRLAHAEGRQAPGPSPRRKSCQLSLFGTDGEP